MMKGFTRFPAYLGLVHLGELIVIVIIIVFVISTNGLLFLFLTSFECEVRELAKKKKKKENCAGVVNKCVKLTSLGC